MTNAKPVTDNKEKEKAKKKKDPLEIHLAKLKKIRVEDTELSGADIAAHADALAGAKVALKAIKATIDEAEMILRAVMLRQYCEYFAQSGRPPDLRRSIGKMGSCQVIQQQTAKVTTEKAEELATQGIDLEPHKEKNSYTIRMGAASREATKEIVASLKSILGDDYEEVVSEYLHVGPKFFKEFDDIVKQTLGPDERLDEKMLGVLRVLNPTIQLTKFDSDMTEMQGYDLAYEFAQISAGKKKAAKEAEKKRLVEMIDEMVNIMIELQLEYDEIVITRILLKAKNFEQLKWWV